MQVDVKTVIIRGEYRGLLSIGFVSLDSFRKSHYGRKRGEKGYRWRRREDR